MNKYPIHHAQLISLKRIEGQIRGIQKMILEGKYCVDILTQLNAITGAITRVEDHILKRHLDSCVVGALKGRSKSAKQKKVEEVLELLRRFRKN